MKEYITIVKIKAKCKFVHYILDVNSLFKIRHNRLFPNAGISSPVPN